MFRSECSVIPEAVTWQHYVLTSSGVPERVLGEEISSSFLDTLEVWPALGRNFSPQEDQRGGARVVTISDDLYGEIASLAIRKRLARL